MNQLRRNAGNAELRKWHSQLSQRSSSNERCVHCAAPSLSHLRYTTRLRLWQTSTLSHNNPNTQVPNMYFTPASIPSSSTCRRIASDTNLQSHWSLMDQEARELVLRDWQLERRQLQKENQRLTKMLDDANKQIRILQNKKQRSNEEVMSVTSDAATVKAGSSRKVVAEQSCRLISSSKRQRSLRIIDKIFPCLDEGRDEVDIGVPVIEVPPAPVASCDARSKVFRGMSKSQMKKSWSSSMVTRYLQTFPDDSFDSIGTEATTMRASSEPRLAEF